MSAYPPDFKSRTEDERNRYFADEAKRFREAKTAGNGQAEAARELPPIFSRDDRLVSAWIKKDIPLRDRLLGGVFCTTSRWLIVGETGIGKTLLGLDMAAATAAGEGFLNWDGQG